MPVPDHKIHTFITRGRKILGISINYKEHLKVHPKPENPTIFLKPTTSYTTQDRSIRLPPNVKVEEQVELGVILNEFCRKVSVEDAMKYVGGYCVALDLTATDLEERRKNGLPWDLSKSFDSATPVSDLVLASEIGDPHKLQIWCTINGKETQNGSTDEFIYQIPELISYCSHHITLEPYDLILTGTPPDATVLKVGDVVECGIRNGVSAKFNVTK